jgi:hypothetical protein
MLCVNCKSEAGDFVLCEHCRKFEKKSHKKAMIRWHEIVCEGVPVCFHCRQWMPRDMICGDHFWFTKGARPDLKFNVLVGVKCCQQCNTSGNNNRLNPKDMRPPDELLPYL